MTITEFLDELRTKNYASETVRSYKTALTFFEKTEITRESIIAFQSHLLHVSPVTRRSYLHKLKRYLNSTRPELGKYIEIPKVPKTVLKDIPSEHVVDGILEKPDTSSFTGIRDRAILELVYATGIRRAEIAGLTLSDIDTVKSVIRITQGKNGRDRVIPISKRALEWIRRYVDTVRPCCRPLENYVFISTRSRKGLSAPSIAKVIRKYSSYSPHKYRHAYATHLLHNGIKETTLQRLLGHEQISTTAIYTKVTITELKKSYFKYHTRDSWKGI